MFTRAAPEALALVAADDDAAILADDGAPTWLADERSVAVPHLASATAQFLEVGRIATRLGRATLVALMPTAVLTALAALHGAADHAADCRAANGPTDGATHAGSASALRRRARRSAAGARDRAGSSALCARRTGPRRATARRF